jgi:metallo-beta-lactamase family protein
MLLDSAKIQEEDAIYLSRKLHGEHPPVEPLYTIDDVRRTMRLFEPCEFLEWHPLDDHGEVRLRFSPAGHILGSAIVELEIDDAGDHKRIVFTGDLGRREMPLIKNPTPIHDGADVLICESTYGNRLHSSSQDIREVLLRTLLETEARGGRVVIPAFALGRTQQITYHLNALFNDGRLPRIPIFIDSPLASKVTQLFERYQHNLDADVQETLRHDPDPFHFAGLITIQNQKESMQLNRRSDPFVVISASGMCESGRVVHHLKHAVSDPRNTILLMGYQAPHTLGRHLANQEREVRIFGRSYPLRAQVLQVDGLSAHADVSDFKWWFEESTRTGHIGQVFLVHGEPESAQAMAALIRDYCDHDPIVPTYGESFEV